MTKYWVTYDDAGGTLPGAVESRVTVIANAAATNKLDDAQLSTATDLGGGSPDNTKIPSQAAVKSYVDTESAKGRKAPLGSFMTASALVPRTPTADFPTITRASAHGYSSPTTIAWNAAGFANIAKGAYLQDSSGLGYNITTISGVQNQYFLEFWHVGTDVALRMGPATSSNGFYQVWVDGHAMTYNPVWEQQTDVGVNAYLKLNWATSKRRKVRILIGGFMALITVGTIYTPSGQYVTGTPQAPFRVAIIGDSYIAANHTSEGTGSSTVRPMGLAQHLALKTGWEVYACGVGSSGYTAGTKYSDSTRMTRFGLLPAFDLIIVFGSSNDVAAGTSTTMATNATTLYEAIATARPGTPVVVVGPQGITITDPQLAEYTAALKTAAEAEPNVIAFIDMQQPSKWLTGSSGNITAPTGSGNRDVFIGADNVHPSTEGNDYLASRLVEALRPIEVSTV